MMPQNKRTILLYISLLFNHPAFCAEDKSTQKKPWTFMVYFAADNNLKPFVVKCIKRMAQLGSNNNINLVAQLDTKTKAGEKITRRYYIEKNKVLHMNYDDPTTQKMDSGNPKTLISFCKWAITNYPAKQYAVVLWNHGSGIIDPITSRSIDTSRLYMLNPEIGLFELDRRIPFLDLLEQEESGYPDRGICWDDTTGHYMSNQGLEYALKEIKKIIGKKIDLLGLDACLMSMIEVANITKHYAQVSIGSEEVGYNYGWDYYAILSPFVNHILSPKDFARHIVATYKKTYTPIINDFTHSALDLKIIYVLEKNIDTVARLLIESLSNQKNNSVKRVIKASRNGRVCTHFNEPSYIDLHHFYTNLLANLKYIEYQKNTELKESLRQALTDGCKIIDQVVFANVFGKGLRKAKGISIYFPERRIHLSYRKTNFVKENAWGAFISRYLQV